MISAMAHPGILMKPSRWVVLLHVAVVGLLIAGCVRDLLVGCWVLFVIC